MVTTNLKMGKTPLSQYMHRAVPLAVNDYVEIGTLSVGSGGISLLMTVVVSDANFSVSKRYEHSIAWNQTGNAWRILAPIFDSGLYIGNNFEVLYRVVSGVISLRIRRSAGATVGTANIRIHAESTSEVTFTASTLTGTDASIYTILGGNPDFWRKTDSTTPDSFTDPTDSIHRQGHVTFGGNSIAYPIPSVPGQVANNNFLQLSNDPANRGQLMYGNAPLSYYMERTSPTVVNNYIEIGSISKANASHSIRLSIAAEVANYTVSKQYMINVGSNFTNGGYKVITPITESSKASTSANDFELLCNVVNGLMTLRIRKRAGTTAGTLKIRLEYLSNGSTVFSESQATGTDANVYPSIVYIAMDTVKFATVLPAVNGSEVDGDHLYITSNGTSTGTFLFEYVFSKIANAWVLTARYLTPYRLVAGATTFTAADQGGIIDINSAGAVNLTFPTGLLNNSNGIGCKFTQLGAGAITAIGGAGVTINADITATTFGVNSSMTAYYRNNGQIVQVSR